MKYKKGSFITVPNQDSIKGIAPEAQCLYMWMCYYANQSGDCFPSHKTLSAVTGMGITSVKKYILELEKIGVLEKEIRKDGNKNKTNLYSVILAYPSRHATHPPVATRPTPSRVATDPPGRQTSRELNPLSLTQSNEVALTQKTEKFIQQLKELMGEQKLKSDQVEELKKFVSYWTEPNKSRTKIKWEMETTWDTRRRIATWMRNAEKFSGGGKKQNNKYSIDENEIH